MNKIIITGVTGQDGSILSEMLLDDDANHIYGAYRRVAGRSYKNLDNISSNPFFSLVDMDLTDPHSVSRVVSSVKPDFFINFAANSFVGNSWDMPVNHFETNCMGVVHCLEAIRQHAPHCKFVSAGTSEMFGDVQYSPQDEKHPLRPRSPYGASKCAAHHAIKVYRESYGMHASHAISFNHESVKRGVEFLPQKVAHGVARISLAMKNGKNYRPLVVGNLDAKRDWSHANDIVRGIWKMANLTKPKDYVLASGKTHTIRDLISAAFQVVGIECAFEGSGFGEKIFIANADRRFNIVEVSKQFYRPAEVDLLMGDYSLAKQDFGWEPKISFNELIKEMVCAAIEKTKNEKSKTN